MAINSKDITTSITLELDRDEIPLNEFRRAVDDFFGLVKEVAKESVPTKDPSAWLVKLYPGSAGIGVSGRSGVFTPDEVSAIRTNVLNGLKDLQKGSRHPLFNDKAVEYSKRLSTLFVGRTTPATVRIWGDHDKPLDLNKDIAVGAAQLLDVSYEDEGSVEGFLEKLNAHGQFEFVVYDPLDNRPITCEVQEDKLHEAWSAWRKRVEVVGKVRYRRDGLPVNVKAQKIIPFPGKDEIPTLEEMRALLRGA